MKILFISIETYFHPYLWITCLLYICTCMLAYIFIYICIQPCIHARMYVCCEYVQVYTRAHVYTCSYIHYVHKLTFIHIFRESVHYICTCINKSTCIYLYVCTQIYFHPYLKRTCLLYLCTCMFAYIPIYVCIQPCVHAFMYVCCEYAQVYTRALVHTCTHKYVYNSLSSISLENLFIIRPDGVTSKKLIGLDTNLRNTLSCRCEEAFKDVCNAKFDMYR